MKRSYSQYFEDLELDKAFKNKTLGFYVDVGANDPRILSNTYHFYLKGWRGINIEPDTDLFTKLEKYRKEDINLNIGIARRRGKRKFFNISAPTLSTFSEITAIRSESEGYKINEIKYIDVIPLSQILDKYLVNGKVDFFSIDVEGYESEVLRSNNWRKYRPEFIIIEINRSGKEIKSFLESKMYRQIFENGTNAIFRDNNLKN
ncbi:FkbM family methyltransferase [Patescibacteria group bacterium]|nr:FkbM family methyltransferase [Patescibacteria group bacterium]